MSERWPASQPASPKYEVQLAVFSGPLELLLHLIERRELDITVVSLAAVTEQFVAYIEALPEPDPDHLAEFLVVAAKLLAIKAKALIARPDEQLAPGDDDNGEDLVRALREYQLFRRVAARLREWEDDRHQMYPRQVMVGPIRVPDIDGLQLADLIAALRRRLAAVPPEPLPSLPSPPQYTVAEKLSAIEAALATASTVTFGSLLPHSAPRLEIIVTFLALLELLKARRISVGQTAAFGEIVIAPYPPEPPSQLAHPH